MDDSHISIDIDVKDGVSGPARVIITSLDKVGDAASKSSPKVEALDQAVDEVGDDAAKTAARIAYLERRVKTLGNESIKSMTKMGAMQAQITRLGQKTAVAGGSGGIFDRLFHGSKSGGSKRGGFLAMGFAIKFMRFFKLILIPTIFDAVGAVSTLASAFGAMASAAIGGLGPVIGLLGAIPSLLAAVVQGAATLKLGFSGLGDAIKVLNDPEASPEELGKALENLGPKTQQLARNIADLQKPFTALKKQIGNELAPGFITLVNVARTYLPLLRKSLTETARTISNVAGRLGNFLKSAGARSDLGGIMGANNTILKKLGTTVVPVFKALLNVMTAATPMVIRFVDEFAAFVRRIAASTGDRKALRNFFEKTYTVTKGLIKVIADLSMAFFNIFKQGASWGGEMGRSIMNLTERFREWTETAEGQQSINNWFTQMKPIVSEVVGIVADLAKGLASVSMDKTLVATLQTIRNDTIPALVALLQGASGKFIEPLSRILGTLASIMVEFKAFPTILNAIAKALEIIAGFIQGLPGPVKQLLGYMVTLGSIMKFGGMLGFLNIFGAGKGKQGMLASGLSNTKYVMGQVIAQQATMRQGFGLLGSSAKKSMVGLLTRYAPAGLAASLGLMAAAIWDGNRALKEMRTASEEAMDAFNKGVNATSVQGLSDQIATVKSEIDSYNRWNIFDKRTWQSAWANSTPPWVGREGGFYGMMAGTPESPNQKTWDQNAQSVYDDLITKQNTYYTAVQQMMNKTGQGSLDYWNEVAEAAGVTGTMGVDAMTAAMTRYDNANRAAMPAALDIYQALKTIGDASADAAAKASAFETVLSSLQTIMTGGSTRDSKIAIKQGWQGVAEGLSKANLNKKMIAEDNWALNDAMKAQRDNITALASAEMERTKDAGQATAIYKEQYDILKKKIIATGVEKKDAQELLDKYLVQPKFMRRALEDDGFRKMIENGKFTYDELRRYIRKHPLVPKVKINNKFKTSKMGLGAMSDVKQKVRTESVAVRVKGEQKVESTIDTITRDLLGLSATPTVIPMDDSLVKQSQREIDTLASKIERLASTGVGVNVDVTTDDGTRRMGGPVFAGQQYLVGEAGPEAFVSKGGAVKMIGLHGREYRTFATDGVVVPNHALAETVPANRGGGYAGEIGGSPVVNIGTINAKSDFDVVEAVKRGVRDAERNRRERM